jgi:hypothetical protein
MQSTGKSSRVRRLLIGAPLLSAAMAVALACGGDDSDGEDVTSPSPTAAGSPAATASATPAGGTAIPSGTPSPTDEPTPTPVPEVEVIPVEPFEVQTAEAINVRDIPSTSGNVVGIVFPGDRAKVLGEAHGEAVEAGDDTWYKIEVTQDGATVQGFLYAPFVAPAS